MSDIREERLLRDLKSLKTSPIPTTLKEDILYELRNRKENRFSLSRKTWKWTVSGPVLAGVALFILVTLTTKDHPRTHVTMALSEFSMKASSEYSTPSKPVLQSRTFGGIRAKDIPFSLNDKTGSLQGSGNSSHGRTKGFEISGPLAGRPLLSKVLPVYPAWAGEKGIRASARIYYAIDLQGHVNPSLRITKTTGYPALDQLAINAVKQWTYAPSSEQGDKWGIATIEFEPNSEAKSIAR